MYTVNVDKMNGNQIEILDKETKYLSKALLSNTNMQSHYICLSRRATQGYGPEPCIMQAFRWGFTILALLLLCFVLVIFVVIFYDVFNRSPLT